MDYAPQTEFGVIAVGSSGSMSLETLLGFWGLQAGVGGAPVPPEHKAEPSHASGSTIPPAHAAGKN